MKLNAWLLAAKSLTVSQNFTLLKLPAFNAPVTFCIAILICCCKPTFCKIFQTKKKNLTLQQTFDCNIEAFDGSI